MIGGTWTGLDEAVAALEQLAAQVSRDDVVAKAMLGVTRPMAREMEGRLYQVITRRTGETGEAIEAQRVDDAADGVIAVEIGPRKRSDGGWRLKFWEVGTSRIPARPFMRPVWEEHASTFSRDVTNNLRDAYDKAVARGRRR